jgi:hypothetical protein
MLLPTWPFFFRQVDLEGRGGESMDNVAGLELGFAENLRLAFTDEQACQCQNIGAAFVENALRQALGFGFLFGGQGGRNHGWSRRRGE